MNYTVTVYKYKVASEDRNRGSGMIKTKIFRTDFDLISGESADEKCNNFIEENKSIVPIDFRFSNSVSKNSLIPTICESILLIYKEVEE